jgi:CRISPR-associated protein Csx17
LFISGGNDGNFDFSVTFMDYLQQTFTALEKSDAWLRSSLFSAAVSQISCGTAGTSTPGVTTGRTPPSVFRAAAG